MDANFMHSVLVGMAIGCIILFFIMLIGANVLMQKFNNPKYYLVIMFLLLILGFAIIHVDSTLYPQDQFPITNNIIVTDKYDCLKYECHGTGWDYAIITTEGNFATNNKTIYDSVSLNNSYCIKSPKYLFDIIGFGEIGGFC